MEEPTCIKRRSVLPAPRRVEMSRRPGFLPLVAEPADSGTDVCAWASENRALIERSLLEDGALLFRNFGLQTVLDMERFITAVSGGLLPYRERSSPRHVVQGHVYTSTEYPASEAIFLHNENSYQTSWPMKLFFFCMRPATSGGGTTLALTRDVLRRISQGTRARFEARGVLYVRNFSDTLGLTWQEVFQTDSSTTVDDYCREHALSCEWFGPNRLRTTRVAPAIVNHPRTGESLWFNHATFFNVATMPTAVRRILQDNLREEELPSHTYYGDGRSIEPHVIGELQLAYEESSQSFTWAAGDLLVCDNMLVAHGREPFTGARKVLVGMAEPQAVEHAARR
jgi:alpha-ketoglutarate-dependent taurine dioxygenase